MANKKFEDYVVAGDNITLTYDNNADTVTIDAAGNVDSVNGQTGVVVLTKTDIGLGNVDNTSDANKPISTATQTALNAKQDSLGYTAENVSNKSITLDTDKLSNTKYPSVKSVYDWAVGAFQPILGFTPVTNARTLTINGTTYDLSANRTWSVGDLVSTGSYANPTWLISLAWGKLTGTPTTLSGYGITDAVPSSRTLTINGTSYDLSADRSWTISTATPTLAQVTTSGNVTTNAITVGGLTTPYVQLDTAATPTLQPGMFGWNDAYGTADLRLKGGNVTLQLGQETLARVVNKTGADLLESDYKVVRVRIASEGGAQGQRLAVVLAQGNNDPDSVTTLGIVTENIDDNQEGFITVFGNVNNINTTGSLQGETWVDGDVLYLSPTTPGSLTKVKPQAPDHTVTVGYVVYAHANQGKIFVKVDNGYELDELHNVKITSVANNDLLQYDSTQQVWKNVAASVAVPTPTLNQVTTAGNTTTNAITVGGLTVDTDTLVVDSVNNRVGIGTSTPLDKLHLATAAGGINNTIRLSAASSAANIISFRNVDGTPEGGLVSTGSSFSYGTYQTNQTNLAAGSGGVALRTSNGANAHIRFYSGNADLDLSSEIARFTASTGNLLINTTTDAGYKLDVNGTTRLNGALTLGMTPIAASSVVSTHKLPITIAGTTYYLLASNI